MSPNEALKMLRDISDCDRGCPSGEAVDLIVAEVAELKRRMRKARYLLRKTWEIGMDLPTSNLWVGIALENLDLRKKGRK